jgi:enoyl-CoA hydratase/carnithine racemase
MILEVDRQGAHWTLTLNRPEKANALSPELVEALVGAIAEAEDAKVAVIAFRGNGRNLSAGFDFTGYEAQSEGDLLLRFVRVEALLQTVARSPCLTVAFAHGKNFGAGVDLMAACKWRVAAPEATFRMPGLGFGLVLGTRRFAGIVGRDVAREILEGLQTFDASRAKAMGFVRAVAATEAWPSVIEDAQKIAMALSPEARATLYATLSNDEHDADLASLVRSATVPGLKDRIRAYLVR